MNISEMIMSARRGEFETYKLSHYEFKLAELIIGDTELRDAEIWIQTNVSRYRINTKFLLVLDSEKCYLTLCKSCCNDEGCFCDSSIYLYKQHWDNLLTLRHKAYQDLLDPAYQENIYSRLDFSEEIL